MEKFQEIIEPCKHNKNQECCSCYILTTLIYTFIMYSEHIETETVLWMSLNSIERESTIFGDCQFLTYAIISLRGFCVVGFPLYTFVWEQDGMSDLVCEIFWVGRFPLYSVVIYLTILYWFYDFLILTVTKHLLLCR